MATLHACPWHGLPFGEYANQVTVVLPWAGAKVAGIDACMVVELKQPWDRGIRTIESCCGHGREAPYIAVVKEHAEQMVKLGYRIHGARDDVSIFYAKTHAERAPA